MNFIVNIDLRNLDLGAAGDRIATALEWLAVSGVVSAAVVLLGAAWAWWWLHGLPLLDDEGGDWDDIGEPRSCRGKGRDECDWEEWL